MRASESLKREGRALIEAGERLLALAAEMEPPAIFVPDDPAWLKVALREIGTAEIAGDEDNPRIVEYHSVTSLRATDDETPWCSSFVSWCLEQVDVPSTRSAASKSYREWGAETTERPGAVAVFDHGGGRGHVAFYVGRKTDNTIECLGGNQSDTVKVSTYSTDRLHSYRWPAGLAR